MKRNIRSIFMLLIQAVLILFLLALGDYLFSLYNPLYLFHSSKNTYAYLLLTIIGLLMLKANRLKLMFFSVLLLGMLIQYLHFSYFGMLVQPISFFQIFNNTNEIGIAFFDRAEILTIPLLITLFIAAFLYKIISIKTYSNTVIGWIIISSIFFSNTIYVYNKLNVKNGKLTNNQATTILPRPKLHAITNFGRSFNYFMTGILPKKILTEQSNTFESLAAPNIKKISPNSNIILIIGESLRSQNTSLLGYKANNTTPLLSKIDELYVDSIYAAGTMTKTSIPGILNRLKYPGATNQIYSQKNCLFNLAKKNGFKTHFLSSQKASNLHILQSLICRKHIDNYETRTEFTKKNKHANKYDLILKAMLKNIDFNKNNFVVLHQRGSHIPFTHQYPKQYSIFNNTYDNSILYTDYVLSEIIKFVQSKTKKETHIIFTSDHGELIGEHGINGHGWFYELVYKVPFMYLSINANDKAYGYKRVQSHFGVSNLIASLLGYDADVKLEQDVYINGTDIDALTGYLHIQLDKNNIEQSVEEYRY